MHHHLSDAYHNLRSIRIIPIEEGSLNESLNAFDSVVEDIESNINNEVKTMESKIVGILNQNVEHVMHVTSGLSAVIRRVGINL